MDRANESSMSRQPLPERWVAKIFQAMQGNYGTRFLNQWKTGQTLPDGSDAGVKNAMAFWGDKLAGFADQPERIARVLDALPGDPPSLPQFAELCRQVPAKAAPAIQYKPSAEDQIRHREMAEAAAKAAKKPEFDGLMWAKCPKSQKAMDMVADAKKHASRFPALAAIFDQLVEDGIASEAGKLLKRFDGVSFVSA